MQRPPRAHTGIGGQAAAADEDRDSACSAPAALPAGPPSPLRPQAAREQESGACPAALTPAPELAGVANLLPVRPGGAKRRLPRPPCAKRTGIGDKAAAADDDSGNEASDLLWCRAAQERLARSLADGNDAVASKLHFVSVGAHVRIEELRAVRERRVPVSELVAATLAGGMDPSCCVALHSGRLVRFDGVERYRLQRSGTDWLLVAEVADGHAFFNFAIGLWQPLQMATHGPYAPMVELLYVAFAPERSPGPRGGGKALFVKLGYRELATDRGEKDYASLVSYVEKKSRKLRITNNPGAGIFIFRPSRCHDAFLRRCRAAEASLKSEFLNCGELVVTPTDVRGNIGTFSASLEYLFIEERAGAANPFGPLPALTGALRRFAGNPDLLPYHAFAAAAAADDSGPQQQLQQGRATLPQRCGSKRLWPWAEPLPSPALRRAGGVSDFAVAPKGASKDVLELAALRTHQKRRRLSRLGVTRGADVASAAGGKLRTSRAVASRRLGHGLAVRQVASAPSRAVLTQSRSTL